MSESGVPLRDVAAAVDEWLRVSAVPDYPHALNGVQVEHRGPVRKLAAAVDVSTRTIRGAIASNANLLLVHHGLFWGGLRPLSGTLYSRARLLIEHDIALYSAHLPLDAHETFGNSVLLAVQLELQPTGGFGRFENIHCGVLGDDHLETAELLERVRHFSHAEGGTAVPSAMSPHRRTRRWAICSGAGVNAATLDEARNLGVDTLITGEGPHWSAVEAEERDLVIIYAGHYATETLGVRALAGQISAQFDIPWSFVAAPTGL